MPRPVTVDHVRILELYESGVSRVDIAATLRIHLSNVQDALEDVDNDGLDDDSGHRCGCGLRLPCNDCVGDVTDYMATGSAFVSPGKSEGISRQDQIDISKACDRYLKGRGAQAMKFGDVEPRAPYPVGFDVND